MVNVYIDHCLYHRCFYLDSRVQVRTSFFFFLFMARVPSVYVFFFFDVVFVNEYVCLNIDALICEHIK